MCTTAAPWSGAASSSIWTGIGNISTAENKAPPFRQTRNGALLSFRPSAFRSEEKNSNFSVRTVDCRVWFRGLAGADGISLRTVTHWPRALPAKHQFFLQNRCASGARRAVQNRSERQKIRKQPAIWLLPVCSVSRRISPPDRRLSEPAPFRPRTAGSSGPEPWCPSFPRQRTYP